MLQNLTRSIPRLQFPTEIGQCNTLIASRKRPDGFRRAHVRVRALPQVAEGTPGKPFRYTRFDHDGNVVRQAFCMLPDIPGAEEAALAQFDKPGMIQIQSCEQQDGGGGNMQILGEGGDMQILGEDGGGQCCVWNGGVCQVPGIIVCGNGTWDEDAQECVCEDEGCEEFDDDEEEEEEEEDEDDEEEEEEEEDCDFEECGDEDGGGGEGEEEDDPEPCDTGDAVIDSPVIQDGFQQLWANSHFGALPESRRERGGWIMVDSNGDFQFQAWPLSTPSTPCSIPNIPFPAPAGVVGYVHTHPWSEGESYEGGGPDCEWRAGGHTLRGARPFPGCRGCAGTARPLPFDRAWIAWFAQHHQRG